MFSGINWREIVREIPEEEQQRLLEERARIQDVSIYGRDGFIETWRRRFVYKGIPFDIAILRYYVLGEGFQRMSFRRCDRHVVVEPAEEIKDVVRALEGLGIEDFLRYDTLHEWNEEQDIWQQLEEAYLHAVDQIDHIIDVLNDEVLRREMQISELRRLIDWFSERMGDAE